MYLILPNYIQTIRMKAMIFVKLLFLIACSSNTRDVNNSLVLAGNNRNQLEKVIHHYKRHNDNEKDKLRAACFLIANMKDKGTYIYDMMDNNGNLLGYNISDFKNTTEENNWLDSIKKVHGKLFEYERYLPDLQYMKAEYLIANIERAFRTKQNSPYCKGISEKDFYEYILPYRVSHEKLEYWWDSARVDLNGFQDSIYSFSSVLAAANFVDDYYQDFFRFGFERFFKEKKVRSYSELVRDKIGKCSDMCNLVLMGMRTLGIPCGMDNIRYKRASDAVGHEWVFVLDVKTNKTYPFDALSNNGPGLFNLLYDNSPRVFRSQFEMSENAVFENNYPVIHPEFYKTNEHNVTDNYFETTDINIEPGHLCTNPIYLCIWFKGNWKPIDCFYDSTSTKAVFTKLSKNNLYCLLEYGLSKKDILNEPFILNRFGEVKYSSTYGRKAKTCIENYGNRALVNAENDKMIFLFDRERTFQPVARKIVNEKLSIDKWVQFDSLYTNTLYYFSDSLKKQGRVIVFNDNNSFDWY